MSFPSSFMALFDKARDWRDALTDLVRELPACDECAEPAAHAHTRGGTRYCAGHAPAGCPPLSYAGALKRAERLIGRQRGEGGA